MGENSNGVSGNFLCPEEIGRTDYKRVPGGVVVPPRRDNYGRSPAFDPKDFLKNIPVNIFDGDQVVSLKPGEADEFGNPIAKKEEACSSPLSPTPTTAASASPAPPTSPSPPSPGSSPGQEPPASGASTTTKTAARAKRSLPPPGLEETLTSLLQPLSQRLSSLESGLSSLTKSIQASSSPESTKDPSSASTSTTSSSSPSRKVKLESQLGSVVFEALTVSAENEGLLAILVDPMKPYMAPKTGEVLVVVDDAKAYHCEARDLSVKMTLGGQQVLLILLVLLEDMTP